MKKFLLLAFALSFASLSHAKYTHLDLVFKTGQVSLDQKHKDKLKAFLRTINSGDDVAIYPLTYDSVFYRHVYSKLADIQAAKIVVYAQSLGLIYEGTPRNFPSEFKGVSVRANFRYYKPKTKLTKVAENHFPEKPSQLFEIDPNKDTILVGKEGTIIYLDAGALQTNKNVEIELKEYYSLDDYVKSGLQTSSNGQMIETGGTIYLNAREKGTKKTVGVNPSKGIGLDFTLGKDDDEMQIFVKDPNSRETVNWILPNSKKRKGKWKMTEKMMDHEGNVISERVFTSREEWEAHLRARKAKTEQREKIQKTRNEINKKLSGKLKVYKLGLINCDKFYDEPVQAVVFAADDQIIAEYYLVMNDVRGLLKGEVRDDFIQFGSVPSDKKATLVAFSFVDDKSYFFRKSITIGSHLPLTIKLEEVDESFINEQLALLK
jgi:hypothetical protein